MKRKRTIKHCEKCLEEHEASLMRRLYITTKNEKGNTTIKAIGWICLKCKNVELEV